MSNTNYVAPRGYLRPCCRDPANFVVAEYDLVNGPIIHRCRVCGFETYLPDWLHRIKEAGTR